jgi:F-type H+-transporting ATPase subunit b
LDALGINLGFLLAFTINFLIVVVVLRKWVYIPILSALEKRRVTIARGLEDARVAAEARENAEKEAAKITMEAQAKAGQIVREANERAEAVAREVKAEAETEAAREREVAWRSSNRNGSGFCPICEGRWLLWQWLLPKS